ncbi:DNA primase [Thermotomaculum hydrothermale]|uniref:DNA primase n=1 Tax=Thermotomaculum hydrothermale TaxID=981385 RepID=A0A7R6PNC7_9BACT|nr:CHC2 zinc finger domain-containing protein [Thermotomaculum hydrothermale]BBB33247.1 DNA primase [Thermotomaculum hydrothermale]
MKLAEKIKYQVPIKAVLDKLGVKEGALGYFCPFHKDETGSLIIKETDNTFKCSVCKASGDQIEITKKVKGFDFEQAIEFLAKEFDIKEDKNEGILDDWLSNRDKRETLESVFGKETEGEISEKDREIYSYISENTSLSFIHQTFLEKKGFDNALIEKLKLSSIEKPHLFVEELKDRFGIEALDKAGLLNRKREFVFQKNNLIIPFFENGEITFLAGWDISGGRYEFVFPHHKTKKCYIPQLEEKEEIYITGDFRGCFAFLKKNCFSVAAFGDFEKLLQFKGKKIFVCGDKDEKGQQFNRKIIKFFAESGVNYTIGGFENCFTDYLDYLTFKRK